MAIFGPLGDEDPEIEDVEIELPEIEPEVSIVDDVPEDIFAQVADETPAPEEAPPAEDDEGGDEPPTPAAKKGNKKSFKARMNELYGKWREEERQKAEAQTLAMQLYQRLQHVEQQAGVYAQSAVQNELRSLDAEIDKAERDYLRAREDGDLQAEAKATRALGALQAKRERTDATAASQAQYQQAQPQYQPQYRPQAQQPAYRAPPTKAVEWADKNKDWFKVDPEATKFAVNYSSHLLQLGISDEDPSHYAMVDAVVKAKFPHVYEDYADDDAPPAKTKPKAPSPVAAVGARMPATGKIRLSDNPQFMHAVHVAKEMDPRIDTKDPKVLQELYKSFTKDQRK